LFTTSGASTWICAIAATLPEKIPNPKSQIPTNSQIPNPDPEQLRRLGVPASGKRQEIEFPLGVAAEVGIAGGADQGDRIGERFADELGLVGVGAEREVDA